MNKRQLECFIEVGKRLSFSAAAETLYLTQPTVSYQIAQLEKELGFSLLQRDTKKVVLTEAGAIYLKGAQKALRILNQCQQDAQNAYLAAVNRVSIANYNYIHDEIFVEAMAAFSKIAPEIEIIIRYPNMFEPFNTDIVIVGRTIEGQPALYKEYRLHSIRTYCIMRENHHLSGKTGLYIENLRGYQILVPSIEILNRLHSWHWKQIQQTPGEYCVVEAPLPTLEEIQTRLFITPTMVMLSRGRYINLPKGLLQIPFLDGEPLWNMLYCWEDCEKTVERLRDFLLDYYKVHG